MNFVQCVDVLSQHFTALGHSHNGVIAQYQQIKPVMDHLTQSVAVPSMPQAWPLNYDVPSPQAFSAPSPMPQAWSAPVAGVMPHAWFPPSVVPSPPGYPFPQR